MSAAIDFAALKSALHETPEILVDQKAREGISPYLLETILPLLMQSQYPRLRDIDFDQFDLEDPPALVGYIQECGQRVYQLTDLNRKLCSLSPACIKTRAFL